MNLCSACFLLFVSYEDSMELVTELSFYGLYSHSQIKIKQCATDNKRYYYVNAGINIIKVYWRKDLHVSKDKLLKLLFLQMSLF